MKFGGFYEHQCPRPWNSESDHRLLHNAMEQVELSDKLGFDYVWATEHHFLEEYAHSSAPEVFLAACSQRTKNVRLGHGIIQMPPAINHPARVAERVASLDLISDGRVDYGFGAGASETELGGFYVDQETKKLAMLEGARTVIEMMTQEPFHGFEGDFIKVPGRNIVPKPLQKPHPPLWMACSNRDSIAQAARLGVGALTFSFVGTEQASQYRNLYYETLENEAVPIGYSVNPNFAIACPFLCDRDEEKVFKLAQESYGFFIYGLGHYSFFGEHRPGVTDLWDEFHTNPKDFALPEGIPDDCVGSPERIRKQLKEFEKVGIDQVIMISQAGNIPHELLCSSIELFCKEVLPEFKERDLADQPKQAERQQRLNDIALPRRPETPVPAEPTLIRAAGHH